MKKNCLLVFGVFTYLSLCAQIMGVPMNQGGCSYAVKINAPEGELYTAEVVYKALDNSHHFYLDEKTKIALDDQRTQLATRLNLFMPFFKDKTVGRNHIAPPLKLYADCDIEIIEGGKSLLIIIENLKAIFFEVNQVELNIHPFDRHHLVNDWIRYHNDRKISPAEDLYDKLHGNRLIKALNTALDSYNSFTDPEYKSKRDKKLSSYDEYYNAVGFVCTKLAELNKGQWYDPKTYKNDLTAHRWDYQLSGMLDRDVLKIARELGGKVEVIQQDGKDKWMLTSNGELIPTDPKLIKRFKKLNLTDYAKVL